jgi:restriction endonuclease Mrr
MAPEEIIDSVVIDSIINNNTPIDFLSIPKYETIFSRLFINSTNLLEISKPAKAIGDMLLTFNDHANMINNVLIDFKFRSSPINAAIIESFIEQTDTIKATQKLLVSNSSFTAAARIAAGLDHTLRLIDNSELVNILRSFEKTRTEFASTLSKSVKALHGQEIARVKLSNQGLVTADQLVSELPHEYHDRFIRVEQLPTKALKAIADDPRHLHSLSSREFEVFMAQIAELLGMHDIILTPPKKDGGRDVIATQEINGIPSILYFECKKFAAEKKVGVGLVRSLLGVVAHEQTRVNKGVLVTTSSFTKGAKDLIVSDVRLGGKDYQGIIGWISEIKDKIIEI